MGTPNPHVAPRHSAPIHGAQAGHPQRLVHAVTTFDSRGCLSRIGAGPSRRWLGLEHLDLLFHSTEKNGSESQTPSFFLIAPRGVKPPGPALVPALSSRSRGTAGDRQGDFAQDKSHRHHLGSVVQYVG